MKTSKTGRTFEIRKDSTGYGRWQVWEIDRPDYPHEGMIRKCTTKKEATYLLGAMCGDLESSALWYRHMVAKRLKSGEPDISAWENAAIDARIHGFSPGAVNADAETGEPLS